MTEHRIDSLAFFDDLAVAMTADPERYERLGDIDLDLVVVMRRPGDEPFRVRLTFLGIECTGVNEAEPGEEGTADCWLEGDIGDWQAMIDNIATNGHAVGEWTLNTLTLFGERIALHATDPMGEDRFHRFNQTLQEFVDAAARRPVGA